VLKADGDMQAAKRLFPGLQGVN